MSAYVQARTTEIKAHVVEFACSTANTLNDAWQMVKGAVASVPWGTVGQIALMVGGAALTIATLGAAGPIIGTIMVVGLLASTAMEVNDMVAEHTGTNFVRDTLLGGNAGAYAALEIAVAAVGLVGPGGAAHAVSKIDDVAEAVTAVSKIDDVADAASAAHKIDNATHAASTSTKADDAADTIRGLNNNGGVITQTGTNAAGGRIFTATGDISQNDFAGIVDSALWQGDEVHIFSGVHGTPSGETQFDPAMLAFDTKTYADTPEVKVYDIKHMAADQVQSVLDKPGTIIGGFCNSGACIDRILSEGV